MYQLLLTNLFLVSYCIAGFSLYQAPMQKLHSLTDEQKVITFLFAKKEFYEQKKRALEASDNFSPYEIKKEMQELFKKENQEMRITFQQNRVFKVQYLSAESLLKLDKKVINNFVKKHWHQTNNAFTCPMQVRLDLFEELVTEYQK